MIPLRIHRTESTPTRTAGQLMTDEFELYTLEPPWKDNQRMLSCVPLGTYQVKRLPSHRFGKIMPTIVDVPERDGILFHSGNTVNQTSGCVLVGSQYTMGALTGSHKAYDLFDDWLVRALEEDQVSLTIS